MAVQHAEDCVARSAGEAVLMCFERTLYTPYDGLVLVGTHRLHASIAGRKATACL